MIRNARNARRGLTLTEVLVAMFVMAIGMLSLLTLFPLGAMQVGQALRDDRTSQVARSADAHMRQAWRHQVIPNVPFPSTTANIEPFYAPMDDPNLEARGFYSASVAYNRFVGNATTPRSAPFNVTPGLPRTTVGSPVSPYLLTLDNYIATGTNPALTNTGRDAYSGGLNTSTTNIKSYPVFVDPHGEQNFPAPPLNSSAKFWVGANSGTTSTLVQNQTLFLPRRQLLSIANAPSPVARAAATLELGGLTDDMTFRPNGTPDSAGLGRQGRFTWAAVVQRPRNDIRDVADLQILVFDRRLIPPTQGDEYVLIPHSANNAGDRQLTVTVPAPKPDSGTVLIRRGGWIMDGTLDTALTPTSQRNAYFYRIAAFTEDTATPAAPAGFVRYLLDLDTPLKANVNTTTTRLYLFGGLIEVFPRPQLRPDSNY